VAGTIYMVCAVTAALCAYLLLRSHARSGYKLLLWSGLCFGGLTINNILLVVDKLVFEQIDLLPWRSAVALLSMCILLYGLVWDAE